MRRKPYSETERQPGNAPHLRPACMAQGCPCDASIYDSVVGEPKNGLCRYHALGERRSWPAITEVLRAGPLDDASLRTRIPSWMRFYAADRPEPVLDRFSGTSAEIRAFHIAKCREILARPGAILHDPSRGWARKLQAREAAGETLLPVQRRVWREALGIDGETEAEREARIEREGMAESRDTS